MRAAILSVMFAAAAAAIGSSPVAVTNTGTVNPSSCSGAPTCTVTVTSTSAGDTLILVLRSATTATTISSISGCGGTWAAKKHTQGTSTTADQWAAGNISGGCTSVLITFSNTTSANWATEAYEWSGLDSSGATDGTNSNTGTGTTLTSNSVTPTGGANVLIFFDGSSAGTWSPATCSNSFTNASTNASVTPCYQVVASASGSYSTGVTKGVSSNWAANIVVYAAAAGGGGGGTVPKLMTLGVGDGEAP